MNIVEPTGQLKWVVRERSRKPAQDHPVGELIRIACRTPLTTETRYTDAEMSLLRGEPLRVEPRQVIRFEQTDFGGFSHKTRQLRLEIRKLRANRKAELSSAREELLKKYTIYQTKHRVQIKPVTVFEIRRGTAFVQLQTSGLIADSEDRDQALAALSAEADRLVYEPGWLAAQVGREDPILVGYSVRYLDWHTKTIRWTERKWIPLSRGRSYWKIRDRKRSFRVPRTMQIRLAYSYAEARIRRERTLIPYTKVTVLPEFRKVWFDTAFEIRGRYDEAIRRCLALIEEARLERRLNAVGRFHYMESGTTAGFIPEPDCLAYHLRRQDLLPGEIRRFESTASARYANIADTTPRWGVAPPGRYWDWTDRPNDPDHIRLYEFNQFGCHFVCAVHTDDSGRGASVSILPQFTAQYSEVGYDSAGYSPADVCFRSSSIQVLADEREALYPSDARESLVRGAQLRAALRLGDLQSREDSDFSIVRSTAELKDLPETYRQAVDFLVWCRQSGVKSKTPLKIVASAYLANQFAVQPTIDDVSTLLKVTHDFLFSIYRSRTRIIRQLMGYTTTPTLRRRYVYPLNVATRSSKSWDPLEGEVLSEELPVEVQPRRVFFGEYVAYDGQLRLIQPDARAPFDAGVGDVRLIEQAFYALSAAAACPLNVDGEPLPLTTAAPSAPERLDRIITRLKVTGAELPVDEIIPVCQHTKGVVFSRVATQVVMNELSRSWGMSPFEYATLISRPAWLAWELYPLSFLLDWISDSHDVVDTLQSMLNKLVTGVSVQEPTWATERTEVLAGCPEYALVPSLLIAGGEEYSTEDLSLLCPPDCFGPSAYRMLGDTYSAAFATAYSDAESHPAAVASYRNQCLNPTPRGIMRYYVTLSYRPYRAGQTWKRTGLYRSCRYPQQHDALAALTSFGFLPRVKSLISDLGKLITLTAILKG